MRIAAAALIVLAGCLGTPDSTPDPDVATPEPGDPGNITVERLWGEFDRPLLVTHDGTSTYVVEQCGKVWRMPDRELWLDVSSKVSCSGEQGLLGMAFPPDHATTGLVYISYTDTAGTSVLERLRLEGDAPGTSGTILIQVAQPASNHNGGHIGFGPDGMLYMALGDGGAARDAFRNGQNKLSLLGSILRLDVAGAFGDAYTVPEDNPFVGDSTGADEIWAWGLRNPWRFSFDPATGDLWHADVGQDAWEEINWQPADSGGGENYGWPVYEGTHLHEPGVVIDHTPPVAEYANAGDCSVTGGHVYRGTDVPGLVGRYVLGDYCTGIIRVVESDGDAWRLLDLMDTSLRISSFGTDPAGELYVVDHQGAVHRFTTD